MRNLALFICLTMVVVSSHAQTESIKNSTHYIGLQPSFLLEPYDTINALEVNMLPFVFERRFDSLWAIQFRPILNYRFYEPASGFSQSGASLFLLRYAMDVFNSDWLDLVYGPFTTYTYNQLDEIHTVTLGAEAGLRMRLNQAFSMNANLQPGVNYYPNQFSRDFVQSEDGLKSHFGLIFHIGYNF